MTTTINGKEIIMPVDTNGKTPTLDSTTNATNTVDYAHHEIHAGSTFKVPVCDQLLADDGTLNIMVTTPNTTKWGHMIWDASCGGNAVVRLTKNPTTSGGSSFTPINKNMNSATASTVTVKTGVTVTDDGTVLDCKIVPGGTGGNASGGGAEVRDEWIMEQNQIVLLQVSNIAGSAKPTSLAMEWYEHTNK
jgi:hypothetical protein